MIKFNLKNQEKYDRIVDKVYKLQTLFGLKSKTIEERQQDIVKRKQEELELQKLVGQRRLHPRWKV